MQTFKIMVYNTRTGAVWFTEKKFSGQVEADKYCEKRSGEMYIVTRIG